jgi:hypothetical protein
MYLLQANVFESLERLRISLRGKYEVVDRNSVKVTLLKSSGICHIPCQQYRYLPYSVSAVAAPPTAVIKKAGRSDSSYSVAAITA